MWGDVYWRSQQFYGLKWFKIKVRSGQSIPFIVDRMRAGGTRSVKS
jgi:hypothetical protein